MSVRLFVCLFARLFCFITVYIFTFFPSVCLSVCLCFHPSISLSVRLSVCFLFTWLSLVCLPVYFNMSVCFLSSTLIFVSLFHICFDILTFASFKKIQYTQILSPDSLLLSRPFKFSPQTLSSSPSPSNSLPRLSPPLPALQILSPDPLLLSRPFKFSPQTLSSSPSPSSSPPSLPCGASLVFVVGSERGRTAA